MARKPRILASSVLITKLAEHGLQSTRLWHVPGPANTQIVWISAYQVNGVVIIVQTMTEGWEVYTPGQSIKIDDTVADVIARVTPGAHRA